MTASRGPDERVVIPRWRSWRTSEEHGELSSLRVGAGALDQVTTGEDGERELLDRIKEFEQWRGVHFAADVVATAVVLGLEEHVGVQEAATELLSALSPSARALAERVIYGTARSVDDKQPPTLVNLDELRPWLAKQKLIVREQPRNVLAWADLALAHTVLGQANAAERAIRVALAQAKGNRFVLRSAARFYIHREDFARAHDLLTADTDRLRADPWLLAAEIAIADSSDRPQRHASYARTLLQRGFAPHDLSELASALATIDLKHGRVKQARRLLNTALVDPTDNTLAQAEWSVARGVNVVDAEQFNLPRNYEALARYHYRNKQFDEALRYGQLWLADQPFALDPALFTSYVAATLVEDQETAIQVCEIGLRTNRHNPTLLNNLAFSLASSNRLIEARKLISQPMIDVSKRDNAIITATRGLIAFRSGDPDAGRKLYRSAVEVLIGERETIAAASAALFWVYEELCAGGSDLRDALKLAESTNRGLARNADLALPRLRLTRLAKHQIAPDSIRVISSLELDHDGTDGS